MLYTRNYYDNEDNKSLSQIMLNVIILQLKYIPGGISRHTLINISESSPVTTR